MYIYLYLSVYLFIYLYLSQQSAYLAPAGVDRFVTVQGSFYK